MRHFVNIGHEDVPSALLKLPVHPPGIHLFQTLFPCDLYFSRVNISGADVVNFSNIPLYNPEPRPLPLLRPYLHADQALLTCIGRGDGEGAIQRRKTMSAAECLQVAQQTVEAVQLRGNDTVVITNPMHTTVSLTAGLLGSLVAGAKVR